MKKSYHHGNLKLALVEHAIKLLEKEGLTALSLRRVAREAGVSQAAPYTHFKDKHTLLAAVANEGFKRFVQRMQTETLSDSGNYLTNLGRGYIFFALENPALFHLMFGGELANLVDPGALDDSAEASYQLLVEAVSRNPLTNKVNVTESNLNKQVHANTDILVTWSLVHGLAMLLIGKNMTPKNFGFENNEALVDNILRSRFG
ncbi:MAG: TetR/AcrR family transcriptional regulator [Pseudomonadales bacterium]|nr:TetR/AcrR family transcriptional regulator [Pseudomonadales bacterium]